MDFYGIKMNTKRLYRTLIVIGGLATLGGLGLYLVNRVDSDKEGPEIRYMSNVEEGKYGSTSASSYSPESRLEWIVRILKQKPRMAVDYKTPKVIENVNLYNKMREH